MTSLSSRSTPTPGIRKKTSSGLKRDKHSAHSPSTSSSRQDYRPVKTPSAQIASDYLADRRSSAYSTRDSSPSDDSSFEDRGSSKSKQRRRNRPPHSSPHGDESTVAWLSRIPRSNPRTHERSSGFDQLNWDPDEDDYPTVRVSASSTLSQLETPPQTPRETSSFRNLYEPVVVAAPIAGVETMDALVDGMNGFGGDDSSYSATSSSKPRRSKSAKDLLYHPLYQPPLPTPPPGVVLGGGVSRKSSKMSKKTSRRDYDDEEAPEMRSPRLKAPRPQTTRTGSSITITPSNASTPSIEAVHEFPTSIPTVDDILRKHSSTVAPSISDIIRRHAPATGSVRSKSVPHPSAVLEETEPENSAAEGELVSRSSVDSVAAEIQQTLYNAPAQLQHARSFPDPRRLSAISDPQGRSPAPSIYSSSAHSHTQLPPSMPDLDIFPRPENHPSQAIATYLRSSRLTTLLRLTRSPHASREQPLTVSLSDLGSRTGRPLVVFLGLGCVRQLMGLYDEMAELLGLRLITIDRWGLGRTDVPRSKAARGIPEWATVVAEVLDRLKIDKCSVMAHSAGAPYALSFANKYADRIQGDICLLAPWVGGSESSGYKWLKYIPHGLIKTAQAAEWKVQTWMLGKPPKIAFEGIGYNAAASTSTPEVPRQTSRSLSRLDSRTTSSSHPVQYSSAVDVQPRPSTASSTFSYDDLRDFDGRFESKITLAARPSNDRSHTDPVHIAQNGAPMAKRKPSKGFLGRFGRSQQSNSEQQQQSPVQSRSPGGTPNGTGRTLRALRSIGSLKSKAAASSMSPSTAARTPEFPRITPTIPQPLTLDVEDFGLGDIEWTVNGSKSKRSSPVERFKEPTPEPESMPVTPTPAAAIVNPIRYSREPAPITTVRASGSRSLSLCASTNSATLSVPPSPTSFSISPTATISPPSPYSPGNSFQAALGNALIAASHAESSKGTHSDLLQILNHDERPWGFSYHTYPHEVDVWYGDRDEKIAENAVRWMERNMGEERCRVNVVKGADHGLMYNSAVVVDVLERVAEYWKESWGDE